MISASLVDEGWPDHDFVHAVKRARDMGTALEGGIKGIRACATMLDLAKPGLARKCLGGDSFTSCSAIRAAKEQCRGNMGRRPE